MGLTHYWRRDEHFDKDAFAKAARDCKILLAGIDVPLSGLKCQGEPVFSKEGIYFNGIKGQCCETFMVLAEEEPRHPGRPVYSYCKTESLPYDLCVKCALIILKHYLGDQIRVMSDNSDDGWKDAKQLCLTCLKYGGDFQLDSEE